MLCHTNTESTENRRCGSSPPVMTTAAAEILLRSLCTCLWERDPSPPSPNPPYTGLGYKTPGRPHSRSMPGWQGPSDLGGRIAHRTHPRYSMYL